MIVLRKRFILILEEDGYKVNNQNPSGFQEVKGYDGVGKSHMNPVTGVKVPTPHVHTKATPGKVRPPKKWEMPKKKIP